MIQELAAESGDTILVIAAMLLFLGLFVVVVIRVVRTGKAETEVRSRMPLDDGTRADGDDGHGDGHGYGDGGK